MSILPRTQLEAETENFLVQMKLAKHNLDVNRTDLHIGSGPYKEGLDAAYKDAQSDSLDWEDNPYRESTKEHDEWDLGNHHGLKDYWHYLEA